MSRVSNAASAATRAARMSTWAYFGCLVRHPRRTWADLLADPARLRYGFAAVVVVGVGYAITVAGIALSDGLPSTPWLTIPRSHYFTWEAFFIAPVTVLCWILAAGVAHLLCKLLHGSGTFDDTLALLGYAVAVPTLITLIPDAVHAVFTAMGWLSRAAWEQAVSEPGTPDFLFLWIDMLAYAAGLLWFFPLAVATAQRLHGWRAVVAGVAGALVYQGVYVIFIR